MLPTVEKETRTARLSACCARTVKFLALRFQHTLPAPATQAMIVYVREADAAIGLASRLFLPTKIPKESSPRSQFIVITRPCCAKLL